ncbi:hypothetical protein [Pedobacter punctiformis]|uniref:Solute-binding protein family 3/N-terminal domain-containing protein n=1 Tax=Pedobacter punctiformis TaxID=3004097 RepID=A0ABT4L624_9SPHI|nr:hypothetical protein [Pedobacter sp. HCMS5-2]MCZ4243376.1 hypothetical protein [Pedobacter sp. HCMS5-2]
MKTCCTLFFCLIAGLVHAQLPADTLITYITFENLKGHNDGYGASIDRPIGTGAFKNLVDRSYLSSRMAKLENSYRWPDGTRIDFTKRNSEHSSTGIVDRYTLIHPNLKDTIWLFVDPYKLDSIFYVPKGLIAINKDVLAKEIAPQLKAIEDINAAKDAYSNEQQNIRNIANYIAARFGVVNFIDQDNLRKVMKDTQAGAEIKNYLFMLYVLNKFYALGKNITQPKMYALNKMKQAFINFQKEHPNVETGNIKINLN